VNEETVPFQLMDKVGPGGSFLTEDHTVNTFKKTFWIPRFFDRKVFENWANDGSKEITVVLNERTKKILNNHILDTLPESVVASIEKILADHQPDVSV
jgi:trimethylamine--corrinoid protein Co-methyltransferase